MTNWPRQAKCAFVMSFDFDAEEVWIGEDPQNAFRPGVLSQGAYGPKVGVPLILDLLAQHGISASFFVSGRDAERHPQTIRNIIAGGHEVLHRLGESRHDAIDLRQEGFGEKSDLHVGRPRLTLEIESPGPDGWSRRKCRGCVSGRSGRPSAEPHPPPRPAGRHRGWWAAGPTQ